MLTRGIDVAILSVHPSIRPSVRSSVTFRYFVETATDLSYFLQRTLNTGAVYKFRDFRSISRYMLEMTQDRDIVVELQ